MFKKIITTLALSAMIQGAANATVIFDSWTTNEGVSGNYIVSITEVGSVFNFELTVNPWNAEALGVFFDLGAATITDTALTNVSPANQVSLFAIDTSSDNCGAGCNLNGLSPTLIAPDGEWEYVFRLGDQGYDGIQTFSWTIGTSGFSESDFQLAGVRAQQLCDGTNLLPDGSCGGSDKSSGTVTVTVPEPSILALMGLGIVGIGIARRRKLA